MSNEYLKRLISRLDYEDKQADEALSQAQEQEAQAKEEKNRISAIRKRAIVPLPSKDACPRCWHEEGIESKMHGINPQDDIDTMKCDPCGYTEERLARA